MPSIRILAACGLGAAVSAMPAQAIQFSWDVGDGVSGTLNSTITAGVGVRMQDRAVDLVGKSNLNPTLCQGAYQSCQGLFRDQVHPSRRLAGAAGQAGMRADDGNLSYDRYDLVQGVAKLTQDLTVESGGIGLFARWLYFYDFVNNDFEEFHPNLITPENLDRVAITGDPVSNRYFDRVYGAGEPTHVERSDEEALRQAGTALQLLDLNVFGDSELWGRKFSWRVGRQTVNWGESFLLAIGSINQANPVNANNLFRTGFQLEEVFTPVGMVFLSTELFYGATLSGYYQWEWLPLEIPTPGTFFSYADLGSDYVRDWVNLGFGGNADDPAGVGHPLDNPLTLLTPTTARIGRLPDNEPDDQGQFGLSFKYYAEDLNYGTEFGLYYIRYHSKLPYVSFHATDASCARREGNPDGIDANSTSSFLAACPNIPGLADSGAAMQINQDAVALLLSNPAVAADLGSDPAALLTLLQGGDPNAPLDDAVPLSTGKVQFEYPENIDLFGVSFNTTFGDWSVQGELAYRPKMPLQVAIMDLAFAGAGPTLSRCHDQSLGCLGTSGGSGFDESGNFGHGAYGSSDFVDENGNNPYPDTLNVLLGHGPGSARSFPSFIIPYRGGTLGETPPNAYIRGWEEFEVFQYNLGLLRVYGASENPIGADQVNMIFEIGAVHIPGLPPLDQLQIEAPGIFTHASAGADGTGADRSRQACSTNPTCSLGADGLRFNPTQAPLDAYVDKLSAGYRVVAQIKYESILPGISLQPLFIWSHDVYGTGPGPAENFVEGRKSLQWFNELRYQEALSFTLGYTWYTGAGQHNLLRDRDNAQFFVKYQF